MPALNRADRNPYDRAHQQTRAELVKHALGTPCPGAFVNGQHWRSDHCDQVMLNPQRMHLDHVTPVLDGGYRGERVCCMPCNTGAGAVMRNQRQAPQQARRTRVW